MDLAVGAIVYSESVSAGGQLCWRVRCYPHGPSKEQKGDRVPLTLPRAGERIQKRQRSSSVPSRRTETVSHLRPTPIGACRFGRLRRLGMGALREAKRSRAALRDPWLGHIYMRDHISAQGVQPHSSPMAVPPPDIGDDLGRLLDRADGKDVSFVVDGVTFHAHRAVPAALSPVFRAELFGSMAEAEMPSITLDDVKPAAFRIMLRFMHTDVLPGDDELGDSPV